ncbi:calcium-dependent cysteine-type endopeptidase [Chaetomidium leptoderma]|uniref:Calcium-dependent cysteine-type endopeptidase n=1 Tax=Chaetomidium leptoderma TaxID=669021 RepID=A0AAN6ZZ89_9PEZI|nr:calcium-dependent cysteine-type endopeptidase [Chaetomidium leptoderma]
MAEFPVVIQRDPGQAPLPPQRKVDEFWEKFTTKAPGKATTLLPRNELAARLAKRTAAKDLAGGSTKTTSTSYDQAADLCRAKVEQIVKECKRINQKYRDPHFDLDFDLRSGTRDCLESLSHEADDYSSGGEDSDGSSSGSGPRVRAGRKGVRGAGAGAGAGAARKGGLQEAGDGGVGDDDGDGGGRRKRGGVKGVFGNWPGRRFSPKSVKRVGDIFDDPKFYIDGPTANDVRQGRDGDCWLMAALCTLSNKPGLIERVCVARDQNVGVYGFVFHRDGEWFSEIIDDKLYLLKHDYDEARMGMQGNYDRYSWEDVTRVDSEEEYRKAFQSNSPALYFAQCAHPNETWLPLLEKAYAKAHGDYAAIEGGFTGEGLEDLTGGVTTEVVTTDILDKEHFWKELMQVNEDFLFGCSTGLWGLGYGERKGIQEGHAYSIMKAKEIDGERLLLLKNPWGKVEWKGAWSDGSKEWTAEWLTRMGHQFGDDGAFWMSYKDLLRKFQTFDRTRLFGQNWKVTSMWTTLNVAWSLDYHDTKFSFTLAKSGPVVIALSQLDDRYFRGLQGQYIFGLGFRVHKAGEDDYLVRSHTTYYMDRSCNVELDLEAGEYTVLIKIDAERTDGTLPPEDVVRLNAKKRRDKLTRIGLAYDLAHSKARPVETAEEKAAREAYGKHRKEKRRTLIRKGVMELRKREHYDKRKEWMAKRKESVWQGELQRKRAEKREAKRNAKREAIRKAAEEAERQEKEEEARGQEGDGAGKELTIPQEAEQQPDEGKQPLSGEDSEAKVANEKKGTEAEGKGEGETGAAGSGAQQDQPAAESKDDEELTKSETAEPEATTSAEEDTPPASTSETAASEAADATAEKTVSAETAAAVEKEDTSEPTIQPTETSAEAVREPAAEGAPGGAQPPTETASNADSTGPNAAFNEKIRTALEVVSSFKKELEGLLGEKPEIRREQEDRPGHEHVSDYPDVHNPSLSGFSNFARPRSYTSSDGIAAPPVRRTTRGRPLSSGPPVHSHPVHFADTAPADRRRGDDARDCESEDDDPDDSDICSVRSVSDISDGELDHRIKTGEYRLGPPPAAAGSQPPLPSGGDEVEKDPWNAVAVVGLRIYYRVAEGDKDGEGLVKLRVVRPNRWELTTDDEDDDEDEEKEEEEEEEEEEGGKGKKKHDGDEDKGTDETKVLDVDDSAKDAAVKGA